MIPKEKKENQAYIEKTIEHIKKLGYTNIQADIEGYDSPTSFEMKSQNLSITPDIVSTTPSGQIHYIEVGLKTDNPSLLKSKWKFLNTLAEMKKGSFRVVSHRGHYRFTDNMMSELNLSSPVIRL
tara:strand:+ start:67150 stop:67524 length:375 start_codon:yes stop_codon:yes gene_type:complete